MGKNLGLVAIAALLLTGCASTEEPQAAETVTATATPEAAPLTVQDHAEPMQEAPENPQAAFLAEVKAKWEGDIPSDQELLNAGDYACEQYGQGMPHTDIKSVIGDSEAAMENNLRVNAWAGHYLCPEFGVLVK